MTARTIAAAAKHSAVMMTEILEVRFPTKFTTISLIARFTPTPKRSRTRYHSYHVFGTGVSSAKRSGFIFRSADVRSAMPIVSHNVLSAFPIIPFRAKPAWMKGVSILSKFRETSPNILRCPSSGRGIAFS